MADPYVPLPDDGESVDALTVDFDDALRDALPGWQPSNGAVEVALRAGWADEISTLYALLRERADDTFRDYGAAILAVTPAEARPASTTTTWYARDALGPYTIEAGIQIVIDAPTGRVGFEVVTEATIPAGQTQATGVVVQALEAGTEANGATGSVLFDTQPTWVDHVTIDSAATGGSDEEDDDTYLGRVARAAQALNRAPTLPRDFELAAQEIPSVTRALALDNYDDTTGLDVQERTVSVYPIDAVGLAVSATDRQAVADLIASRRELNWIVRVGIPTYTPVDVDITVAAAGTVDTADLQARVAQTIADEALNPALHGQPPLGERQTWHQRRTIWRYEIASTADRVDDVEYVTSVHLAAQPNATTDADLTLAGAAPLPQAGTINVTVVAAE